jgi:hypothetical protein
VKGVLRGSFHKGLAPALTLCAALLVVAGFVGCRALDPTNAPEDLCQTECKTRAKLCSREQCERGCQLVLDRIIERQSKQVIDCVASQTACTDTTFATCGARMGAHVDGGPPGPPKPPEDYED